LVKIECQHAAKRRGIVITDVVLGISLVGTLLVIMSVTLGYDNRSQRASAQHQELTFEAEAALTSIQSAVVPQTPQAPDITLAIEAIQGAASPAGYTWVQVTAQGYGQISSIIGLIPEKNANLLPAAPAITPASDQGVNDDAQ